ncbi:MAG: histidine triad nucleotide-binding protein [Candidatus Colwellbacteria bacterium RIFCSPLOWO2_12_FULL_44_13]|uniref:Histidine triad nucleotide-binding protein n=1 Tax=Candidatus Colwellbacteria bacterium RIFCSPLOWO2_12_FULL_44_13 TaxID=1797694 RepID=A0A1G1ZC44_9BACT|nr:MAG: histidine triad nucleotide-binding protein [Candidatus Colwellbacteria bacterium RIFCSPLOWO2_12_FULL_44_13]
MNNMCIFCKIGKKEIPSEAVFEDNEIIAFRDVKPSAPVHILVIPKEHIQSIAHLEGNHKDVIVKLIYTAKDVAAKSGLTGYKLVFNVGREGGQVIDHLHLHLLGGWTRREDIDAMPHPKLDQ